MRGLFKDVLEILTPRERRDAAYVLIIILVTGLAETAAVGAIAAYIAFLADPDSIQAVPWLPEILQRFGWQALGPTLIAASLSVLGVLVLKNAFVAFATWTRVRFIWGKLYSLSTRLLERYLSQPYEYFLTRNSAVLSKNFLVEINLVVGHIIRPGMSIISEAIIAVFITAFLFWYDAPLAAMVVAIFGGGYPLVYWATRRTLQRIGKERLVVHEQRFKMAHEALGGIKEVKVFGREHFYLKRYKHASLYRLPDHGKRDRGAPTLRGRDPGLQRNPCHHFHHHGPPGRFHLGYPHRRPLCGCRVPADAVAQPHLGIPGHDEIQRGRP